MAYTGNSSSGNVLTSNGASALPSFQNALLIIQGDTGLVSSSSITLTGGTSGAVFTASGSTITESFNSVSFPATTAVNGQILINSTQYFHGYGTDNIFFGKSAGNFTLTGTQNVGIGSNTLALLSAGTPTVAIGYQSMANGIVSGAGSNGSNVAIGASSLYSVTSGFTSVAIGASALNAMLTTQQFTGLGASALARATSSNSSTGIGYQACYGVTSAGNNQSIGSSTLNSGSLTGAYNTAFGYLAGSAFTTSETSNICINNNGVIADSHTCRIGAATGSGNQQLATTFIHGIRGITTVNNNAIAVLVDSAGQLGTVSSSVRYKNNIEDMGNLSSLVMKLRPVTFDFKNKPNHKKQIGLIAEEVKEIIPSLVVHNQDSEVESVKYHDLSILLLNEIQKALERIKYLESKLIQ